MRLLVTGSGGRIGSALVERLVSGGHQVRAFDVAGAPGQLPGAADSVESVVGDIRDKEAVRRAAEAVDTILHLAAIPGDRPGMDTKILDVNVAGTWNVLYAARDCAVPRVVVFSSVNAIGCVGGRRWASYLPIDDNHPHVPTSPYQISKHMVEELCRAFSDCHDVTTICLRPVYVTRPEEYERIRARADTPSEHMRSEYFAYVDLEDVCDAATVSLTAECGKYDAFLLTASDTVSNIRTAELASRCYLGTPWRQDPARYCSGDPFRSLIDCSHAREMLGWTASRSWRQERAG